MKGSQPQIFAAYNAVCLARETATDGDQGDGKDKEVVVDDKETEDKEAESENGKDAAPAKKEVSFRSKEINTSFGSKPLSEDDSSSNIAVTIVIILVVALIFVAVILAVYYFCFKRKSMIGQVAPTNDN